VGFAPGKELKELMKLARGAGARTRA